MSWLKELRKEAKMTQDAVAKKSSLSRAAYTNIETGKRRPSVKVAKALGKALGFDWTRFYEE